MWGTKKYTKWLQTITNLSSFAKAFKQWELKCTLSIKQNKIKEGFVLTCQYHKS